MNDKYLPVSMTERLFIDCKYVPLRQKNCMKMSLKEKVQKLEWDALCHVGNNRNLQCVRKWPENSIVGEPDIRAMGTLCAVSQKKYQKTKITISILDRFYTSVQLYMQS